MIFQGGKDRFGSVFTDLNSYSPLLSQCLFIDINRNISKILPKKLQFPSLLLAL